MKVSGETSDEKMECQLRRRTSTDETKLKFTRSFFVERFHSSIALITSARCFNTGAKAFRNSMKSFTALTPFWRGMIYSFSDNPPLVLPGASLIREILFHELHIFYHSTIFHLPLCKIIYAFLKCYISSSGNIIPASSLAPSITRTASKLTFSLALIPA